MSGTSPNLPLRLFTVTIADFRSSLAGVGRLGFAAPLRTIAGPCNGTAFRFRGGRL